LRLVIVIITIIILTTAHTSQELDAYRELRAKKVQLEVEKREREKVLASLILLLRVLVFHARTCRRIM
jgi:hypothetical protein